MTSALTARDRDATAMLFAALADPTRLRFVEILSRDGPQSVSTLTRGATMSRQAVTKHLQVLDDSGVTTSWREGRRRMFRLQPREMEPARAYLEHVAQRWDAALERLKVKLAAESGDGSRA